MNKAMLWLMSAGLCIFSGVALAQGTSLLKPGDVFPSLGGRTVAGKPLDLPTAAVGKVAV